MCDHLWFDYRVWCILFQIDVNKIDSITKFVSKYIDSTCKTFNYNESKLFRLENNDTNYKLIRDDAERFRPFLNLNEINYPKIPEQFYGVDKIDELISEITKNGNYIEGDIPGLLDKFENDVFPNLSESALVDRIVIVTIIVCEYLECSYLQGMHDIIGCLSFLSAKSFPITMHILLSIEIILKWGRFLLLPSLFSYHEDFQLEETSKKRDFDANFSHEYESENAVFGFVYDIFLNEVKVSRKYEPDILGSNLSENQSNVKFVPTKNNKADNISLNYKEKVHKYKKCGNYSQCTIKQLVDICNEFQMFGNFHAPLIFNKIERLIESNVWCCGVFVTCGSSLFLEIQNVLLFWLNLLFCCSSTPYRPPHFPKIKNSLQIPAFLVAVLKTYEHKLRDDIYFIFTEEFKLDSEVNLHIGIVSVLQPFLVISDNLKKGLPSEGSITEYIEDEKRPIIVDLFQIILIMKHIVATTPLSLQRRLINAVYYYSLTETILNNGIVNYINPSEFVLYDSMFFTKNKKMEDLQTIITGKDIVIIDIISNFHMDQIFENHLEFIEKLKQFERDLYSKKIKNLENNFDEEITSVLLIPILRLYLKTTRIVKIPLDKESNIRRMTKQFIEFSSRRQKALLIQKRPSIWIVLGPNNQITDKLISTLLEQGIIGIQLMSPISLINELIDNEDSNSRNESLAGIVKEVINNLIIGNLPSNKNRALLKSRVTMKKNLTCSISKYGISESKDKEEKFYMEQIQNINLNPGIHEKITHSGANLIKFRPNRRKKYNLSRYLQIDDIKMQNQT